MPVVISRLLPFWKPILLAIALTACLYAGWHARGVQEEADQAAILREMAEKQRKREEETQRISADLSVKLTALEQNNRQLSRRLARETANPEYRCRVPSGGLLLLREAVTGDPAG